MNKQEQQEFFIKEIQPYVDLKVREVFDDFRDYEQIMKSVNEPRLLVDWCNYQRIRNKHLTDNSNKEKELGK